MAVPASRGAHRARLETREVRVSGRPVRYGVAGAGEPVVLLHGLSGSGVWWRPVLPALAARHRVYVVDLPGFGGMRRGGRLALAEGAAWLRTWMEASGLERAHLVGHSMGGYIALRLAAEAPGTVDRLVLAAPALLPAGRRLLGFAGPLAATMRQVPAGFLPVLALDALRAGPLTVWRTARDLLAGDDGTALSEIGAPVLLVWGSRDVLVPLAAGRQLRQEIPGARLLVLEGAGHVPMYERPREFSHALLAFLEGSPVGE